MALQPVKPSYQLASWTDETNIVAVGGQHRHPNHAQGLPMDDRLVESLKYIE
jgi:hypothetical protein